MDEQLSWRLLARELPIHHVLILLQ